MPPKYIIDGVMLEAESFKNSFKKLPENIKLEARNNIGALLMQTQMPAKLHFHKLSGKEVWTIHISKCSKYKASFTIENGIAIFHKAGEHDYIDRYPT